MLIKPLKIRILQGLRKTKLSYLVECQAQVKDIKKNEKILTMAYGQLVNYLSEYQWIFRNNSKTFFDKSQKYTQEMLVSDHRNIEQIWDSLSGADYFQMQQVITNRHIRRQIDINRHY